MPAAVDPRSPHRPLRFEVHLGAAMLPLLDDLARLRLTVFRDYPYLYEGTLAHEQEYLATYARCPQALLVLAFDGAAVVGASTAVPLVHEDHGMPDRFRQAGRDPAHYLYLGESVLLPAYRGRGVGVRFFHHREAYARTLGAPICRTAFCGVVRSPTDPRRPADWVPLDEFWRHRGYTPMPGVEAAFTWPELGDPTPTTKAMAFWEKVH